MTAAVMCYTSGTNWTSERRHLLPSFNRTRIHELDIGGCIRLGRADTVLAVVRCSTSMDGDGVHVGVNRCEARAAGAHLDAESLLTSINDERVTISGGVPTVWLSVLDALDAHPSKWDVSSVRTLVWADPLFRSLAAGIRRAFRDSGDAGMGHDRNDVRRNGLHAVAGDSAASLRMRNMRGGRGRARPCRSLRSGREMSPGWCRGMTTRLGNSR